MYRFALIAGLGLTVAACAASRPGKVLFVHDKDGHYVELREGTSSNFVRKGGEVEGRPELKGLREVHGDLDEICTEMHGRRNPRIVVETKNDRHYQVVFNKGAESLKVIAKHLGLVVAQEERKIDAITLRVAKGGHRLKASAKDEKDESLSDDKEVLQFDGFRADELAQHLESAFRRPVVNLTTLKGRWAFSLSLEAMKWPDEDETVKLGDLGLELRWEKVKLLVTVVKDKAK